MLEERPHCVTAAEPEEWWKQMKTILQETMAEVVGLSTRNHQDWFDKADKEIHELLEKKCFYHNLTPLFNIALLSILTRMTF